MAPLNTAEAVAKAHRDGILFLDTLDRLLDDDDAFDRTMAALNKDPEAFSVEEPEEDFHRRAGAGHRPAHPFSLSTSDQRGYFSYVSAIRRGHPMTREREYLLAKRMEFFRNRLLRIARAQNLPDDMIEKLLKSSACPGPACIADLCPRCKILGRCPKGRKGKVHENCRAYNTCRSAFVMGHLHLVVTFTRSYGGYGIPLMDLVQEGNAALIRAVEKYDWRRHVRFQTYATFWIRQAVERSISANIRIVRIPNYLQQKMRRLKRKGVLSRDQSRISARDLSAAFNVPGDVAGRVLETARRHSSLDSIAVEGGNLPPALGAAPSPAAALSSGEIKALKARIEKALQSLSTRERLILEHRFGLKGAEFKTFEELGKMLKVSREMARQIHVGALKKMKRAELAASLRSFI